MSKEDQLVEAVTKGIQEVSLVQNPFDLDITVRKKLEVFRISYTIDECQNDYRLENDDPVVLGSFCFSPSNLFGYVIQTADKTVEYCVVKQKHQKGDDRYNFKLDGSGTSEGDEIFPTATLSACPQDEVELKTHRISVPELMSKQAKEWLVHRLSSTLPQREVDYENKFRQEMVRISKWTRNSEYPANRYNVCRQLALLHHITTQCASELSETCSAVVYYLDLDHYNNYMNQLDLKIYHDTNTPCPIEEGTIPILQHLKFPANCVIKLYNIFYYLHDGKLTEAYTLDDALRYLYSNTEGEKPLGLVCVNAGKLDDKNEHRFSRFDSKDRFFEFVG